MINRLSSRHGVILVFALWVLSFLTVLAVSVAAGIRQKIIVVKRLDERSHMSYILQAAVKKACVYLRKEVAASGNVYTVALKAGLYNNPAEFAVIRLGEDTASVTIKDEASKINLNMTSKSVLTALLVRVLSMKPDQAGVLADALLDWRQYGESRQRGFFSDDYYANLQFPYRKKDADYQSLDEILLVKGVSKEIYQKLIHEVTIYGDGKVNINTASRDVLASLGLDEDLVDIIISVRRGKDGVEATGDDHVFLKTFDVAAEVDATIKLENAQKQDIDALNVNGILTTHSSYFSMEAIGRLNHQSSTRKAHAIFGLHENGVLYWKEK